MRYAVYIKCWYGRRFFCFCEEVIETNGFFTFVDIAKDVVGIMPMASLGFVKLNK